MQLKKNPRGPGDGFPGGPIPTGFDDDVTEAQEDYQQSSSGAQSEHETLVTRPRETPAARSESVIDAHSRFDGKFETDQDLRVEGNVGGEVVCRGKLTIEREATAKAKLEARDAVIRGRLEGDLVCSGKLHLASTAEVTGTLKAGALVVEEGAVVSGNVEIGGLSKESPASLQGRRSETASAGNQGNNNGAEGSERAAASGGSGRPRRDVPSFALVSSEERLAQDRN